ncbi:MAG: ROK family protein [Pirellulales bacterium]|nr:ROK family protein [Pirellulales bacterium]
MPPQRTLVSRQAARPPFFAGVDLGGTNIKVGIVDDQGETLAWLSQATETERGGEDGARRMGQMVHEATRQAGLAPGDIARVGLGSPGTMDIPAGMLLEPHNLGWFNFPIRDRVSHYAGLPVTFANDANAAAYGEYWVGTGREFKSMVLFTLGTGIGCGIIIGDLLVDGENSHGGECGHIIIDQRPNARICGCGQPGHLEAYASATAVLKRTEEALAAGRRSSLATRLAKGKDLTPLMIAEEAEAGDELSLEIVLDTAAYLGVGAVTLMHTIDPSGVVFGGAMTFGEHRTELGRRFLARIREEVQRRAFPVLAARTTIDYASLGGDAGYLGAAGVARLEHYRKQVK